MAELLDPSGAESEIQVMRTSPDPLQEGNNIFLQPKLIEIILSNLPFKEIQNGRLVCKEWESIGNTLIGKKELKNVDFSRISAKDFNDLQSAFKTTPNKINLFKGFKFEWGQLGTAIYLDFLSKFNTKSIEINGMILTSSPYDLNEFLQPSLLTLTDIKIGVKWDPVWYGTTFKTQLNTLSGLNFENTKLRKMDISLIKSGRGRIYHRELQRAFRSFELLFERTCQFLTDLSFKFAASISKTREGEDMAKIIQMPVFQKLTKFKLEVNCEERDVYLYTLNPFDFRYNFPNLAHLEILDSALYMLNETLDQTKNHNLKTLKIIKDETFFLDNNEDEDLYEKMHDSFPQLEEFTCKDTILGNLENGGTEVLWTDTLRKIEVHGYHQDFDLCHLEKLESVKYTLHNDTDDADFPISVGTEIMLRHFEHLPLLKRVQIAYKNAEMTFDQLD